MSKYQPRIIIQDPAKTVPDDIVDKFFLTIKTGDIDKIRDFAMQYKNKYNLIESSRRREMSSNKTPFHVVLGLDDKVADDKQKLRIMTFLNEMGAPMDLPDKTDVWPIHLAAASQSNKLVDFLINNKVQLNRKDSSNNTPLHYAVLGKNIPCPKKLAPGSLAPAQKPGVIPLNQSLGQLNNVLTNLLDADPNIYPDLVHMINTVMKTPLMFSGTDIDLDLRKNLVEIFTETASSPSYTTNIGLIDQQGKIEKLIDSTYSTINDRLYKGVTTPLSIGPNKNGWGPVTINGEPVERIMDYNLDKYRTDVESVYIDKRNKVTSITATTVDDKVRKAVPKFLNEVNYNYLVKLIFCQDCRDATDFGETVGLTKMLYLLVWNDYLQSYPTKFADDFIGGYKLMTGTGAVNGQYQEVLANNYHGHAFTRNVPEYAFNSDIYVIMDDLYHAPSELVEDIMEAILVVPGANDCIANKLKEMFTNSDDTEVRPTNLNLPSVPLNGVLINDLVKDPMYIDLEPLTKRFRPQFSNLAVSWFTLLNNLLSTIKPQEGVGSAVVFRRPNNTYGLPRTPITATGGGGPVQVLNRYTYLELFRIMHLLLTYLVQGVYRDEFVPNIFDRKFNEWEAYIDQAATFPYFRPPNNPIGRVWPEFIFLYRVLVRYTVNQIKFMAQKCMSDAILAATSMDPKTLGAMGSGAIAQLQKYVITDAHMYNILLPSYPSPPVFANPDMSSKRSVWDKNNDLVKWFSGLKAQMANIPAFNNFVTTVTNLMVNNLNLFDYSTLHQVRRLIEENAAVVPIRNYIRDQIFPFRGQTFRSHVRKYFGTFKGDFSTVADVRTKEILHNYVAYANAIPFADVYDMNLANLRAGTISPSFFLNETYGYFFTMIIQHTNHIYGLINEIRNIIMDIISFINNRTIYYIPQIFLPAMIRTIILTVDYLLMIKTYINDFETKKADFYPLININVNIPDKSLGNIIELGNKLAEYVNAQLPVIYEDIIDVINYHNAVVEFLNYHSARQLILSGTTNGINKAVGLFNMNLIPVGALPNLFGNVSNFESIVGILQRYQIPQIIYHADGNEAARLRFEVFGAEDFEPPTMEEYRGIKYDRTGQMSDVPDVGHNSQLNANVVLDANNDIQYYYLADTPKAIAGEWVRLSLNGAPEMNYYDAFIQYEPTELVYDWLQGMDPSIRSSVGTHLGLLKQKIVQEAIQIFIDNHNLPVNARNPDMDAIYENILKMGNESTFNKPPDIKVAIIVGRSMDNLINKVIEYSIRQSISDWVYDMVSTNPSYTSLTADIKRTIELVKQKDYLKLSLKDINEQSLNDLLGKNAGIDYQLVQIEMDPGNLPYTSKSVGLNGSNEGIQYLYDINYFPTGNATLNKKCFYVNTKMVPKLITSDTVNAKNSDGNTPLHLAVASGFPELVELLIAKGASPKGWSNLHGKSPYDMGVNNARIQLSLSAVYIDIDTSITVSKSIDHFVKPFNDVMVSKLLEEKFKNNVAKNITMGIPIQLVMVNHMYHLYLENYRYGFTFELKEAIVNMLKKYYGLSNNVYPVDLFTVDNQLMLERIVEPEIPQNRVASGINRANQRRIAEYEDHIKELQIQLDGLQKEWANTTDPEQLKMLADINVKLNEMVKKANDAMVPLKVPDQSLLTLYTSTVNSMVNKLANRKLGLVEFYDESFKKFGNNMYIGIWANYLEKPLMSAPSMIFPLLNGIVLKIINGEITAETKAELVAISDFYGIVAKYINSRGTKPNNLEENSVLQEDFNQLVYLINLVLTPDMYNILLNQIYTAINESTGTTDDTVMKAITDTKYEGDSILTFLRDKLPGRAVKYYTATYDDDFDPVARITTSSELYRPIVQIIKNNRLMQFTDESLLVQNLNNFLIPFMDNTYSVFIGSLRNAVYGYERYLLNIYQISRILQSLV